MGGNAKWMAAAITIDRSSAIGCNTRWMAAEITMDGSSKIAINKDRDNGQQQHNEQQKDKAIAMGNMTVMAQLIAQWLADNCQWMRGQRWEQCLAIGCSVCCEIWAGPSKNIQIHVYIHRKYILFSQAELLA
jgi:hypothetical protein